MKNQMRTRNSIWFEVKFQYEKTQDDGMQKKVTEPYVVDALSFSEAETKIIEEMKIYVSGDTDVKAITRAPYKEIFFDDRESADKFYKAKLDFITIDERTEKEKKYTITYLVQADTLDGAKKNIMEVMDGTMIDYIIQSIAETKIMDVFEHKPLENKEI